MALRFHLPPGGDVPPVVAARRIGITLERFVEVLPELLQQRFPPANPVTGNYCLEAIDAWRRSFHPQLQPNGLTPAIRARDARDVVRERMAGRNGG